MHITVEPTRILIGTPDFVPRFLDLPKVLQVLAGQTVTLEADSTWDYIEVGGTLRVARDRDTVCRFTHFFILPGGTFDCGTADDPMLTADVRLIVRNVPIDVTRDPFEWGNGLLNFGNQTRIGCDKTEWVEAQGDLAAGATMLHLASAPVNWDVGDVLLIPDTLTQTTRPGPGGENKTFSQREAPVSILSINGNMLTLTKGLDFAHPCIRTPDGAVVLRPRIANLTRCISLESENADEPFSGTRGHTANVGMEARFDIRCNQFIQLGRTLNDPVDDAGVTLKPTTNQKGRYANHQHHVGSAPGSQCIANTYIGNPATTKWAHAVHGTSDILVEREVAVDFPGAAFVTEDGAEVRNVFRRLMAAYVQGTPPALDPDGDVRINRPGSEGSGFWFRGVMNTFEELEAWNCYRSGIDLFNIMQPDGLMYPSEPGMMNDTPFDRRKALPVVFTRNVCACNNIGFEIWGIKEFPYANLTLAFNYDRQLFAVSSDGIALELHDSMIVVDATVPDFLPDGGLGIHSGDGYVNSFNIFNVTIVGCKRGITSGGSVNGINMTGGLLQNAIDIDRVHADLWLEGVTFKPLGALPKRYIELAAGDVPPGSVWDGVGPLPIVGFIRCTPNRGSNLILKNCIGIGQPNTTYRLYFEQSRSDAAAWYSNSLGRHVYNPPAKGLTWQQSWDQFGIGFLGGIFDPAQAVRLDGVNFGAALVGGTTALAAPRAIITYPNSYEAALTDGGVLQCHVSLTGDYTQASPFLFGSVDDGPRFQIEAVSLDPNSPLNDTRGFGIEGAAVTPGTHTLKVWRTMIADPLEPLPGSEYTVTYAIGEAPPPVLISVPNVVGKTKAAAIADLSFSHLSVAQVTQVGSPVDTVILQAPLAGVMVPKNSVVTITIAIAEPSQDVAVPNVLGQSPTEAANALHVAGLNVGTVTEVENTTVQPGLVFDQSPDAGVLVPKGSAVNLFIAVAAPPPHDDWHDVTIQYSDSLKAWRMKP